MNIDPGILPATVILMCILALLTVPLAATIFFSMAALLLLNPEPLPQNFILNYSLALRLNSPALISIPLFGLAGELAVAAGITERLLNLADSVAGKDRHAVGARTILGCTLFASVSGVGPAAVTAEGKRLVPGMLKAGYSKETAGGALACAAGLSILIPASIPLTVYAATIGILTNIVFTASFIPGLIMAAALHLAMNLHSRRCLKNAVLTPDPNRPVWQTALWDARWAVFMPVLVLSSLFTGLLTAPEAAAFSCAYAIIVGRFAHRTLTGIAIWDALARAATGAATVLLMAGMGGLFVMFMNANGLLDRLAAAVFMAIGGKIASILFMNALLLFAGCFLDMPAIITLIAPMLLPLATLCDMSLPHFGVMVVMNISIGLVTPPQAWNVAAAAQAADLDVWQTARGALPFMCIMLVVLALVSFVPELSLWLPRLFGWPV